MIGIDAVKKDQAVLDWAAQNPFLTDALLFQWLGEKPGNCALIPMQGEAVQKRYVDGSARKVYEFALQATFEVSGATDDVNIMNMHAQRQWGAWIEEQESLHNYPDFGDKCSDYSLELLSNGPMLAQRDENGTGKYQFFARINYMEVR